MLSSQTALPYEMKWFRFNSVLLLYLDVFSNSQVSFSLYLSLCLSHSFSPTSNKALSPTLKFLSSHSPCHLFLSFLSKISFSLFVSVDHFDQSLISHSQSPLPSEMKCFRFPSVLHHLCLSHCLLQEKGAGLYFQ
jgi:hypothetical protein